MMKSMTGYGKGRAENKEFALTVEIKSVNHRYCDVTVKAPRALMFLENDIKKRVGARLRRGKIDVFINQELRGGCGIVPVLNRPLAGAYVDLFKQMSQEFGLKGDVPLSLLVAQKDVVMAQEGELKEDLLSECLNAALDAALDAQERMRLVEGAATREDMEARLVAVEEFLEVIVKRAPQVPEEWKAKLNERLGKFGQDVNFDPQRVAQEVAIFADRCDISEEITRFSSHLEQFRKLFEVAEPVGRQMDFLVQELNREVNTMGSKSNDAELTRQVVSIKAELEKIREQVQNIE